MLPLTLLKSTGLANQTGGEKNRLLSLDTEIITLGLATVPRMIKEGKELLLIKHPLCAGCFVSVGSSITSQLGMLNNGARKT